MQTTFLPLSVLSSFSHGACFALRVPTKYTSMLWRFHAVALMVSTELSLNRPIPLQHQARSLFLFLSLLHIDPGTRRGSTNEASLTRPVRDTS